MNTTKIFCSRAIAWLVVIGVCFGSAFSYQALATSPWIKVSVGAVGRVQAVSAPNDSGQWSVLDSGGAFFRSSDFKTWQSGGESVLGNVVSATSDGTTDLAIGLQTFDFATFTNTVSRVFFLTNDSGWTVGGLVVPSESAGPRGAIESLVSLTDRSFIAVGKEGPFVGSDDRTHRAMGSADGGDWQLIPDLALDRLVIAEPAAVGGTAVPSVHAAGGRMFWVSGIGGFRDLHVWNFGGTDRRLPLLNTYVGDDGSVAHWRLGVSPSLRQPFDTRFVPTMSGAEFLSGRWFVFGDRVFTSEDGENWENVWRAPVRDDRLIGMRAMAANGEVFVAVGVAGGTWFSRDGREWTAGTIVTDDALNAVTFDGAQWVAVGDGGVVQTSQDGLNWRLENPETDENLTVVTAHGGEVVIGGEAGTVLVPRREIAITEPTILAKEKDGEVRVEVRRFGPVHERVTVAYLTSDGSATAGEDYQWVNGEIVFEPGELSHEVVIPLFVNAELEDLETFKLQLLSPSGRWTVAAPGAATIEIHEFDIVISRPQTGDLIETGFTDVAGLFSFSGSAGALDLVFVLDSSGSLGSADPRNFRSQGVAALVNAIPVGVDVRVGLIDFDSSAKTLSGLTYDYAVVAAAADRIDQSGGTDIADGIRAGLDLLRLDWRPEADRALILFSDGGSNRARALAVTGTDIPVHTLYLGRSGDSGASLMAEIAAKSSGVHQRVSDPSRLPQLFQDITNRGNITGIQVISDAAPGRVFDARILATSWSASGIPVRPSREGQTTITATITSKDEPPLQATVSVVVGAEPPIVSIGSASLLEGDEGVREMVFPVTLSRPSDRIVTVRFTTEDGQAKAGSDYLSRLSAVGMLPGSLRSDIRISIIGDEVSEPDEQFSVRLTQVENARLLSENTVLGTILNDDEVLPPQAPLGEIIVPSADDVFLTGQSTDVRVLAEDPDGVVSQVEIILDDAPLISLGEAPFQTVWDDLVPGRHTVAGRVTDDEGLVTELDTVSFEVLALPSLRIVGVTVAEGDEGVVAHTLTVGVSEPIPFQIEAEFEIGTPGGSAVAGEDFVAERKTVIIPADAREATLTVGVLGDRDVEEDETVLVSIVQLDNAMTQADPITVTILNDDVPANQAPSGSIVMPTSGTRIAEGRALPVAVMARDVDGLVAEVGLRVNGEDRWLWSQPPFTTQLLDLPVGEHTLNGWVRDDQGEQVELRGVVVTVVSLPVVVLEGGSTLEGGSGDQRSITGGIRLDGESLEDVEVRLRIEGMEGANRASPGEDFVAEERVVQMSAGTRQAAFTVTVLGDDVDEPDEMFAVRVIEVSGAKGLGVATTMTILDDDEAVRVAPEIGALPDLEVTVGEPLPVMTLVLSDADSLPEQLMVNVRGGGELVVSEAQWSVSGLGFSRTLTLEPVAGKTGRESIVISVTDEAGLSAEISFELSIGNQLPQVTISSPFPDAAFPTNPASPPGLPSIRLAAEVVDDTPIGAVRFVVDGEELVSLEMTPYEWTWDGAPVGEHTLEVVAEDIYGAVGLSDAVAFSVTETLVNRAPTIEPITDQVVKVGERIVGVPIVVADVETPVADLVVEFESLTPSRLATDAIRLTEGDGGERTFTIPSFDEPTGRNPIRVKVIVRDGEEETSFVEFSVSVTNDLPVVEIVAPTPFAIVPIPVGFDRVDVPAVVVIADDQPVDDVRLWLGAVGEGAPVASAEVAEGTFETSLAGLMAGEYVVIATVRDRATGELVASDPVTFRTVLDELGEIAVVHPEAADLTEVFTVWDYLVDLGYEPRVFEQSDISVAALEDYRAVIWHDLGRADVAEETVDVFVALQDTVAMSIYFIGDHLASAQGSLSEVNGQRWADLTKLSDLGARDVIGEVRFAVATDADNNEISGYWAQVDGFLIAGEIDRSVGAVEAEVLAVAGERSSPAVLRYPSTNGLDLSAPRRFVQAFPLRERGGEVATIARKILFENALCYLLADNAIDCECPSAVITTIIEQESTEAIEASLGERFPLNLLLNNNGRCLARGGQLTLRLPEGLRLVEVESSKGIPWRWAPGEATAYLAVGIVEPSGEDITVDLLLEATRPGNHAIELTSSGNNFDDSPRTLSVKVEGGAVAIDRNELGEPILRVAGSPGGVVQVESVESLSFATGWQLFERVVLAADEGERVLPLEAGTDQRFYRVRGR